MSGPRRPQRLLFHLLSLLSPLPPLPVKQASITLWEVFPLPSARSLLPVSGDDAPTLLTTFHGALAEKDEARFASIKGDSCKRVNRAQWAEQWADQGPGSSVQPP